MWTGACAVLELLLGSEIVSYRTLSPGRCNSAQRSTMWIPHEMWTWHQSFQPAHADPSKGASSFHISLKSFGKDGNWRSWESLQIIKRIQQGKEGAAFASMRSIGGPAPTLQRCDVPHLSGRHLGKGVRCNWSNIWAFNLTSPPKFRSEGFTCDIDWKQQGGNMFYELEEMTVAGVDSTDCESVQQFLFNSPVHPKHPSCHDTAFHLKRSSAGERWDSFHIATWTRWFLAADFLNFA